MKRSLAKKGFLKTPESAQICFFAGLWEEAHFTPISFKEGVLKVAVSSSSEASELHMLTEELLCFINKKIGENKVKSLRIINQS